MATRIPESLRKEFRDRGQDDGSDYGKGIGLAYATTYATVGALWFPMRMIPIRMIPISRPELLGIPWAVLGLSSFVLFLMFAVKIARYGDRLGAPANYLDDGPDSSGDEGEADFDSGAHPTEPPAFRR